MNRRSRTNWQYRWWMLTLSRKNVLGRVTRYQEIYCADSQDSLRKIRPMRRGESIVKISPVSGFSAWAETRRNRVDQNQVNQALGECADLLDGDVKLTDAIAMQMRRTRNPIVRYHLLNVVAALETGTPLHAAFARETPICDQRLETILRVAHKTGGGALSAVMRELRKESEYTAFVRRMLNLMLVYPYIVLWALMALVLLFGMKIVPIVAGTYSQFSVPLPGMSVVHYAIAGFIGKHPLPCAAVMSAILIAIPFLRHRFLALGFVRWLLYRLPVFGGFLSKNEIVSTVSHMAVSLRAGVTMVEAMSLTGDIFKKEEMAVAWNKAAHESGNGVPIGKAIEGYSAEFGELGEEIVCMIQIGEEGSVMEKQMAEFGARLRERMLLQARGLEKTGTPIIMVALTLVCMAVLIPLQYPMFRMGEVVNPHKRMLATQSTAEHVLAPATGGSQK